MNRELANQAGDTAQQKLRAQMSSTEGMLAKNKGQHRPRLGQTWAETQLGLADWDFPT